MKPALLLIALAAAFAGAQTTPPPATPQAGAAESQQPPPGPPLTLEEALGIASGNGYTLRIANVNVNRQLGRLREVQSFLGPTIGASAGYTRNGTQQFANFGAAGTPPVAITALDNRTLGLSFSIPIDLTGNLTRNIQAQRSLYEAQRETFTATANDLRRTVRRAYFDALRAEGLVGVSQATITNVQEQLRQAELQFREGLVARIDVERLRALLTQFQNELLINQNTLNVAKQALNFQLARPIETPFSLVAPTDVPAIPDGDARLVVEGQGDRPETRALNRQVRSFALLRRSAQSTLEPSLAFGISYQRNLNPAGFSPQNDQTFATLTLSVPLFDAGATRARVQQAQAEEDNARLTLDQTRLSISQEVRTALTGLRTAQARLATATSQVEYATEVERLARVRRDAGEATFLEVVDAQTQLVNARNALVTARFDYLASFADLQRAVGRDDVSTPLPEGFDNPDAVAPRVGRFGERTTTAPPAKPPVPGSLPPANKGGAGEPRKLGETVPPSTTNTNTPNPPEKKAGNDPK